MADRNEIRRRMDITLSWNDFYYIKKLPDGFVEVGVCANGVAFVSLFELYVGNIYFLIFELLTEIVDELNLFILEM